jgi:hypothetical protein
LLPWIRQKHMLLSGIPFLRLGLSLLYYGRYSLPSNGTDILSFRKTEIFWFLLKFWNRAA